MVHNRQQYIIINNPYCAKIFFDTLFVNTQSIGIDNNLTLLTLHHDTTLFISKIGEHHIAGQISVMLVGMKLQAILIEIKQKPGYI